MVKSTVILREIGRFLTNLFLFFCFFAHLGGKGSRRPAVVVLAVVLKRHKHKSLNFFGSRLLFFWAFLACPRARLFSLRFGQNFRVRHGNVFGALHQDPFLLLEDPCHAFRPKLLRACLQLRVFVRHPTWGYQRKPQRLAVWMHPVPRKLADHAP